MRHFAFFMALILAVAVPAGASDTQTVLERAVMIDHEARGDALARLVAPTTAEWITVEPGYTCFLFDPALAMYNAQGIFKPGRIAIEMQTGATATAVIQVFWPQRGQGIHLYPLRRDRTFEFRQEDAVGVLVRSEYAMQIRFKPVDSK